MTKKFEMHARRMKPISDNKLWVRKTIRVCLPSFDVTLTWTTDVSCLQIFVDRWTGIIDRIARLSVLNAEV